MSAFSPTPGFLDLANRAIKALLLELRPELLASHGLAQPTLKHDHSVVTDLDLLVERRLEASLRDLEPAIGFAGEETGADYDQTTFWLVDPIDGTEAFIRGLPFCTNMIALIHEGEVVMSVIYNFILDEYFYATKGGGATMNGAPIHVSDRPLGRAYVIFGSDTSNPAINHVRGRLYGLVQSLPSVASSGFEFSSIARGAIEGGIAYHSHGKPWDFAPGSLLVREAGGRVENFGSTGYDYRDTQVVCAAAGLFDELKSFIEAQLEAELPG